MHSTSFKSKYYLKTSIQYELSNIGTHVYSTPVLSSTSFLKLTII